jgi:hypothetical protein
MVQQPGDKGAPVALPGQLLAAALNFDDLEIRMMKKLAFVLAAAALAGCVAVPYNSGQPHRSHGGPYYGDHDRDRDGISNRADRDRDGDGVPNRRDRRPDNPRRY